MLSLSAYHKMRLLRRPPTFSLENNGQGELWRIWSFERSHSSRSALLIAFGASFAVYLVPLFGPHASWPLGLYLYQWQMPGAPHRVVSWIAMDWGVAVALQVLAGTLWYWVLVRPGRVRILVVAACAPVFVAAAN